MTDHADIATLPFEKALQELHAERKAQQQVFNSLDDRCGGQVKGRLASGA